MTRVRVLIYVIGILIICMASSVATYFSLVGAGVIEGEKINLVYQISDKTKEYDGEQLLLDDSLIYLKEGSLLNGHTAYYSFEGSQTNVGRSEAKASIIIKDKKGYDVTSNYVISSNIANLTVTPKRVEFLVDADDEFYYNGDALVYSNYKITNGSLVSGHKFEPIVNKRVVEPEQTIANEDVTPRIFDYTGIDVTLNYEIYIQIGNKVIKKRPLVVKPVDVKTIYDGATKEACDVEYIIGSLLDGHKAVYSISGSSPNVGQTDTYITDFAIYDIGGNDVTNNYSVDKSAYGKIIIDKRDVVVKVASATKVYDGIPLRCNDVEGVEGLVNGHSIDLDSFTTTNNSSILLSGSIKNEADVIKIVDNEGFDVTNYYNIKAIAGLLTIDKKPLTLTAPSLTREYNGKELTLENEAGTKDSLLGVMGLVDNNSSITFNYIGSIKNCGNMNNSIDLKTLLIQDSTGNDVTKGYEINIIDGTLKITPKYLMIVGKSISDIYYPGIKLKMENEEYNVKEAYGLVGNIDYTNIIVTYDNMLNKVGQTYNSFIINEIEGDEISNYNIQYVFGTITIYDRKDIVFESASITKDYDGKSFEKEEYNKLVENVELYPGHTYEIEYEDNDEFKNAGNTSNVITKLIIRDENGKEITDKYDVTKINGSLIINKISITLTAVSENKYYDGMPLTFANDNSNTLKDIKGLIGNEIVSFRYIGEITNCGSIPNKIDKESIVIKNNDIDITENYDINTVDGLLVIEQKDITLVAKSFKFTYDGNVKKATDNELLEKVDLIKNHTISYNYFGEITNAGVEENQIKDIVIMNQNEDVTNNYNINIINGLIEVEKASVAINQKTSSLRILYGTDIKIPADFYSITFNDKKINLVVNSFSHDDKNVKLESVSVIYLEQDITNNLDFDLNITTKLSYTPRLLVVLLNGKTITAGEYYLSELIEISTLTPLINGDYIDDVLIEITNLDTIDTIKEKVSESIVIRNQEFVNQRYLIEEIRGNLTII